MRNHLLIVGIDPGTTVGYAILDMQGKLLLTCSGKELDLAKLLQNISAHGKPLLIGCDKHKIPGLVESFAAKFSAVIASPEHDLLVEGKKAMTSAFSFANHHEMDALASALFAWRKYQQLLEKIQHKLDGEKKELLCAPVTELVVKHGLSIKAAIAVLEQPEEPSAKNITRVIEQKQLRQEDFVQLYEEIVLLKHANAFLRSQQNESTAKLQKAVRMLEAMEEKLHVIPEQKAGRLLQQKEGRALFLQNELERTREQLKQLEQKLHSLPKAIAALQPVVVLTKLPTLGWSKSVEQVQEGDILLVDEPNIFSEYAIRTLQPKVQCVLCKKPVSKNVASELPFVCIDAAPLSLVELEQYAFVNQHALANALQKNESFKKIIFEYQKERVSQ